MSEQKTGNVSHATLHLNGDRLAVQWNPSLERDVSEPDSNDLRPLDIAVFLPHQRGTPPTVTAGNLVPETIVQDITRNVIAGRHLIPTYIPAEQADRLTLEAARLLS